jgi:ankyrin repeat protein
MTALHHCCKAGYEDLVQLLLKCESFTEINFKDKVES